MKSIKVIKLLRGSPGTVEEEEEEDDNDVLQVLHRAVLRTLALY